MILDGDQLRATSRTCSNNMNGSLKGNYSDETKTDDRLQQSTHNHLNANHKTVCNEDVYNEILKGEGKQLQNSKVKVHTRWLNHSRYSFPNSVQHMNSGISTPSTPSPKIVKLAKSNDSGYKEEVLLTVQKLRSLANQRCQLPHLNKINGSITTLSNGECGTSLKTNHSTTSSDSINVNSKSEADELQSTATFHYRKYSKN